MAELVLELDAKRDQHYVRSIKNDKIENPVSLSTFNADLVLFINAEDR